MPLLLWHRMICRRCCCRCRLCFDGLTAHALVWLRRGLLRLLLCCIGCIMPLCAAAAGAGPAELALLCFDRIGAAANCTCSTQLRGSGGVGRQACLLPCYPLLPAAV